METAREKHITHPPRLRQALEDITHTPNPFVFFFKIWQLLRIVNNESTEVSKDIRVLANMDRWRHQKNDLLGIFYDVFWKNSNEYKIIKNLENRKKSGKRLFRLKTEDEWKKLSFKNGILSKFPDILDSDKTEEYDKVQYIREHYMHKDVPQIRDLIIGKNKAWEITYDLSESAKREIFEKDFSDVHILRKILTYGKRNDLRKRDDHRCPYYERISPDRLKVYVEAGIAEIDTETGKLIEEYYDAYGKAQYILKMKKRLNSLYKSFQRKYQEVEWKKIVSRRDTLQTIVSVTNSTLSPLLLPLVANRLANDLKGGVSKTEIEQYAYLLSNIRADSYDEYLAINRFFSQLVIAVDVRGNFLRHLLQYVFWTVFWLLACIFVPFVFSGIFAAAILGFPAGNLEVAPWKCVYVKVKLSVLTGFLLFLCLIVGTFAVKENIFMIQQYKDRFIQQPWVLSLVGNIVPPDTALKSSLIEISCNIPSWTGKITESNCPSTCYSLICAVEKRGCDTRNPSSP